MREALDSVRPEVRLGVCSCYPNWDQDGMSTYEISKILAGQTRPYLRLSAGPYWVTQGLAEHRLADIVELTRMELSFCGGDTDAEIVSEGDPHPRPRWSVPAAYLEGFDTALRAAGGLSGMQKYSFDYGASHTYETGYNERHIKNLPLYRKIDEMFGDKTAIGVRVYKSLYEFEKTDIPEYLPDISSLQYSCFPYAARLLSAANIPIVWEGTEGVGVAFGESAKYLSEEAIRSGLIIDARAAEILTERGVDVGLVSKSEHVEVCSEKFVETGERVGVFSSNAYATRAYRIEVRDGARVESYFTPTGTSLLPLYSHSPEKYPSDHIIGSYFYENEDGENSSYIPSTEPSYTARFSATTKEQIN